VSRQLKKPGSCKCRADTASIIQTEMKKERGLLSGRPSLHHVQQLTHTHTSETERRLTTFAGVLDGSHDGATRDVLVALKNIVKLFVSQCHHVTLHSVYSHTTHRLTNTYSYCYYSCYSRLKASFPGQSGKVGTRKVKPV